MPVARKLYEFTSYVNTYHEKANNYTHVCEWVYICVCVFLGICIGVLQHKHFAWLNINIYIYSDKYQLHSLKGSGFEECEYVC